MHYLIQGTTHGERIMFRGPRHVLLAVARRLCARNPHLNLRVTDRPADVFGNSLLEKCRQG